MPPKTTTKMFRKNKTKGKSKTKQVVNVKINIDQSKRSRTNPRQPSANIAKPGARPPFGKVLPAFSVAPQGFTGGGVQGPAVVVAPQPPMPQPVQQPDTTTQALTAYNNLILQQAQQQNMWRNRGGLNIQPNFGDFRASSQETNLLNPYQVPYDYYRNSPGIVEEVVDDLTYDDPMVNEVIDNKLDYAPQLPDLTASASSTGMTLEEKQDNALSNLVAKEQLTAKDKQVDNDLNNIDEKDASEDVWIDKVPEPVVKTTPKKKKTLVIVEDEQPSSSSSAPVPVPTPAPKQTRRRSTEEEVANITSLGGKYFTNDVGQGLQYISEIPEGQVFDTTNGRWLKKSSAIYKKAVDQGYAKDIYTTDLGRIHRLRKAGTYSRK